MIYDQHALGMDYLDCSNQTLSTIDFKIKGHIGNIVNVKQSHTRFSFFGKVVDDYEMMRLFYIQNFSSEEM